MAEREDGELVRRAKRGDAEAFGELVNRHLRGVYALSFSFTRNHADADDLTQEAFLRAYRSLGTFKERSSFRTWLYRIAANACANHLGRSGPRTESLDGCMAAANAVGPPDAASLSELEGRVAELTGQLPAGFRVALHLIVNEGLSHRQAAQVLGCARGTVAWRVFRAREMLLEQLSGFFEDKSE
jgi:RNA polymerase sigma-70 factor (ECF subfamily)